MNNLTQNNTIQKFDAQTAADLICAACEFMSLKYGQSKDLSVDVQHPFISGSVDSVQFVAYQDLYGPTILINSYEGIPEYHLDGHIPTLENGGIQRTQEEQDKFNADALACLKQRFSQ